MHIYIELKVFILTSNVLFNIYEEQVEAYLIRSYNTIFLNFHALSMSFIVKKYLFISILKYTNYYICLYMEQKNIYTNIQIYLHRI
jgi:hypothetical protein